MEKAEILEHTVLFLQKTSGSSRGEAAGGAQKDSFQEGFSDCLERAARFLGPQGKGLHLRAALEPSGSACFSSPDLASAGWKNTSGVRCSSCSQLLRSSCKSILPLWLRKPGFVPGLVVFRCVQNPGHSQRPLPSQPMRNAASKQNQLQSQAASHSLWRPWP